jgi:hypothetical protein
MFNLQRAAGNQFWAMAILTTMEGSLGNDLAQLRRDVSHASSAQECSQIIWQNASLIKQKKSPGLLQSE